MKYYGKLFSRYSRYSFAISSRLHIVHLVIDIGYLLPHFSQYICDIGLGYEGMKSRTTLFIRIFLIHTDFSYW